ncbi:MAG: hypothetical protein ACE5GB_10265 [Acidimicrobiales bacterium]
MAAAETALTRVTGSTGDPRSRLRLIGHRVAPLVLARELVVPVLPVLCGLLPEGGLKRGSVVAVKGPGATSLALALAAGASDAGSWTAVVGDPSVGLMAAAETGIALERLLMVDPPDARAWATAMAALVGSVDMVIVGPGSRRPADTRRLSSRLRERGSVVIAVGGAWEPGPDVALTVIGAEWSGLGDGHGVLMSRRVTVRADGRRAAARSREATLLLPGPDGAPAPVDAVDERWAGSDIDRLLDAEAAAVRGRLLAAEPAVARTLGA